MLDAIDKVAGPDKPGTAAGHDFALALRAVRDAAASSDLVVVMIHWGVELDALPRGYQIDQAHRMIDAGADMIFGSHSHRLQPMETYRDRPIFYSLGNLVWPRGTPMTSATAVAEVIVSPDGAMRGRLLPAEIVSDGHPVLVKNHAVRGHSLYAGSRAPAACSLAGVENCAITPFRHESVPKSEKPVPTAHSGRPVACGEGVFCRPHEGRRP